MTQILLNISFDFNYVPVLIVVATAWAVPMLLQLFKLHKVPSVIVEIIAGYLLGRFLLGSFTAEAIQPLEFLALSGFLFLMFLSGLEIDVGQLMASLPKRKLTYSRFLKNPFLVGLSIFLATLVLSLAGTLLLSTIVSINSIFYFSLILITSSVGIIVPVLKARGDINTRFGQMIIVAAGIADILSILLFTFTAFIIKNGFKWEELWILVIFLAFAVFYRAGNKLKQVILFKKITFQLAHASSQIKVRGTILIILTFVVIAQYLGKEVMLLGAFLAGLLLSNFVNKERSLMILQLEGMGYGFFIPMFFIVVGIQFDPSALTDLDESLAPFLILLTIILYAVKIIPSLIWKRLFGYKKAVSGGFLLASRLSLIIAAAKIGKDMEIISPGMNACFIIMAIITCLLSPVIYNYMNPGSIFLSDKIIIVGGSSTAVLLARRLYKLDEKTVIIIENDEKRCRDIRSKGINVVLGDANKPDIFRKINLSPFNYVVILTESHGKNYKIAQLLREEMGHTKIITKSADNKTEKALLDMRVEVIDSTRIIAATIENLIMRPTAYHSLVETLGSIHVEEIKITRKEVDGKEVKDIPFHKDGSLMLLKRGTTMLIPHGDTHLKVGDTVTLIGSDIAINDMREKLAIV